MEDQKKKGDKFLPISILIAAVLVAGAVIYSAGQGTVSNNNGGTDIPSETASAENVAPITSDDYLRGNPDADIVIVEYSDLECPFCQLFHDTMKEVIENYGDRVAWVYRHFPINSLHPTASAESEAAECVGSLGGDDAFWYFVDTVFENTPQSGPIDQSLLPQIAEEAGVSRADFQSCVDSGQFAEKVQSQVENAQAAGAQGTPYSVIIVNEDGEESFFPVNGALPYSDPSSLDMQTILDQILSL